MNAGFNQVKHDVDNTAIIQDICIFTFNDYRYIFTIINQLVNYLHIFGQNNFRYSYTDIYN